MATELIQRRWCDWHLREKDVHESAVEYEVAFSPAAHKSEPMIVDLCEECRDRFGGDLIALMGTLETKRQKERTPTATLKTPGASFPCPVEGCDVTGSKSGLKSHVERAHDTTLAEVALKRGVTLEGIVVKFACEECKAGFGKTQGYAQHMSQIHKVVPPIDFAPGAEAARRHVPDIREVDGDVPLPEAPQVEVPREPARKRTAKRTTKSA